MVTAGPGEAIASGQINSSDHATQPLSTRASSAGGIDMAFDHDAANEDHDHDHHDHDHHDTEPPPARKRWATERDEPVSNLARRRNIVDIDICLAVAPDGDDDVDSHLASVATRLGLSRGRAARYCDVGVMLRRMPKVLGVCRSGAWPHERLATIAAAIAAVSDDNLAVVEDKFVAYLCPRKDFQALPGPRVFARELRRIVEAIEPVSTPPDDDTKPIVGESYGVDNEGAGDFGQLTVVLRKDRLAELDATVRAIRDAKANDGNDGGDGGDGGDGNECSLPDALMALCRGGGEGVSVTMNVYVDGTNTATANSTTGAANTTDTGTNTTATTTRTADEADVQVWLDGAGWLPKYLTKAWLSRAKDVRLSSDSIIGGYVPTEAQKARVRGRDGQCRFPGCDVPAHRCQIDHVVDYDPTHTTSGGGGSGGGYGLGVTATWNLQCLCQRHHNLKTSRHWRAVMHADGSVTWVDHAGVVFATTVAHGPMAHIGRQTFSQRATRRASTIHGDNLRRMKAEADRQAAMEQADIDAALRTHARQTRRYEQELACFVAGPLNSRDPDVRAQAGGLVVAADDGWPCADDVVWSRQQVSARVARGRREEGSGWCPVDVDAHQAPRPPKPLGPRPGIPF
ncbi:HNH endonuclease signature motif containing protein [Corynebacterium freneyi]|uniref:HNH endonuclease signature motif containing protein n=1 Tax=Corynebacterium freneyi TaxID=134034 RepID=UPI00254AAA6F|nr:HNH endonuclease signature motif containing protein [Corynebacterium freneyi]MDK8768308.1 HNH endonuclease signature motif containing protein [Corynebacterium freneyi]